MQRAIRTIRERRAVVVLGAVAVLLLLPAGADSHVLPPEDPGTCPSQDTSVVVRDGRAYRWVSFDGGQARLVSYQFKPGTFPPNMLTFEPTYPQTKFDIDWGWGCLSVAIPECGQVDTTVIGFNPPGTLRFEDAMAAILGGNVLPGTAVLGTADLCTCPEPPPPPPPPPGGTEPAFSAQRGGGPVEPEPCEPTPPG